MENNDEIKIEKDDTDWLLDIKKSRAIVGEIFKFGVSQSQMRNIIKMLALELEDREAMLTICKAIEEPEPEPEEQTLLYPGGNNE